MKNKLIISTLFSAFLLISTNVKADGISDLVDSNKTWTIQFSSEVGLDNGKINTVMVSDPNNNLLNVGIQLGPDKKKVIVTPPEGGYKLGTNYLLYVGTGVHSINGKPLKATHKKFFTIKDVPAATVEKVISAPALGHIIVVVSFAANVDATKYDVKINGEPLTYDQESKKLTVILKGSFTKEELQSKLVVTKK